MTETSYEKLEPWQQELLDKAEAVMENGYNLYSHFYVGSAILTADGQIFAGANMENSSYGKTVCAETAAIACANASGVREFRAIALIGRGHDSESNDPVTPCGGCRQVINEFADISRFNVQLICSNTKKDKIIITSINELYPLPFGPNNLGLSLDRFRK
ncbi:MAG: cytidine deaminase [Patescibacteria group bacterium]|nr:cytidine deaminase [Patescibacteria group bacterium]MBU2509200.1 cytidine deaminase [Patescibacteria group bacterium]